MQFTIIIEFLIPGLATVLISLALLPPEAIPARPDLVPEGETAAALLLLAVSYPVGHLVNFPVFLFLQRLLLAPIARRRVLSAYVKRGMNLDRAVVEKYHLKISEGPSQTRSEIRNLFGSMRTVVFSSNFDLFNSGHLHFQGLQRLTRGMVIPTLLAILLVCDQGNPGKTQILALLGIALFTFLWLLYYCVEKEEEKVADFFVLLAAPWPLPHPSTVTPRRVESATQHASEGEPD